MDEGQQPCTDDQIEAIREQARGVIAETDPCFTGFYSLQEGSWNAVVGLGMTPIELAACDTPAMEELIREQGEAVSDALDERLLFTCELDSIGPDVVEGGMLDDFMEVARGLLTDCIDDFNQIAGSRIVVDSEGRVVEVTHQEDSPGHPSEEVLECMLAALDGLVFPCLAGYEICPEFVIIE